MAQIRRGVEGPPDGSDQAPHVRSVSQWLRLLLGLSAVFGLFQWLAGGLGSDRGQAGVLVASIIVTALLVVERGLFRRSVRDGALALGLGRPRSTGLFVSAGICALLLGTVVLFVQATGASSTLHPGWLWLLPGLFAQAGVAEETLFRGYLYGHLRVGRSFRHAAVVSMLPFLGVHLVLFFTMPWPIALASVFLSVLISFPLSHLFELGGSTMWAPAMMHFVIQGTPKVVVVSGDWSSSFLAAWFAATMVLPLLALCVRRQAPTAY